MDSQDTERQQAIKDYEKEVETVIIIRWSIFAAIFLLLMIWLIVGFVHARIRMKKGLPPMGYHRWFYPRNQRTPLAANVQYAHMPYGGANPPAYNYGGMPPPAPAYTSGWNEKDTFSAGPYAEAAMPPPPPGPPGQPAPPQTAYMSRI